MNKNHLIIGLALSSLITSTTALSAQSAEKPAEKKQIETIVHDYILKNPEVVVQSLEAYQQKQMSQTQDTFKKIQENAPKYADQLFHQSEDPVAGNPDGKVTIVSFSDYQCPHCVEMNPIIDKLVKNNKNVRIVFKEFPIRGPISELAAKAALAANKQGKYYEFHSALMQSKVEPLTEAAIYDIAKSVGLNVDQLKQDMKAPAIDNQIKSVYQLARSMQLIWTPIFFIAETNVTNKNAKPNSIVFIPGRVEESQLNEVIDKV